jgi:hypothetical protein
MIFIGFFILSKRWSLFTEEYFLGFKMDENFMVENNPLIWSGFLSLGEFEN